MKISSLDDFFISVHYDRMIEVTRLDGKKYWINPHQIENMENNPDLTLTLLSGKKVVVRETPQEIVDKIIAYRKRIGGFSQEL